MMKQNGIDRLPLSSHRCKINSLLQYSNYMRLNSNQIFIHHSFSIFLFEEINIFHFRKKNSSYCLIQNKENYSFEKKKFSRPFKIKKNLLSFLKKKILIEEGLFGRNIFLLGVMQKILCTLWKFNSIYKLVEKEKKWIYKKIWKHWCFQLREKRFAVTRIELWIFMIICMYASGGWGIFFFF